MRTRLAPHEMGCAAMYLTRVNRVNKNVRLSVAWRTAWLVILLLYFVRTLFYLWFYSSSGVAV
jgi:hypothetical protein